MMLQRMTSNSNKNFKSLNFFFLTKNVSNNVKLVFVTINKILEYINAKSERVL